MNESLLSEELFRRSFIIATVIGILSRGLVLRVVDKQYPSRPEDYIEQIIMSGLAASLGAIAFPALLDKEFAALTFFAVAIQQFQGIANQERTALRNIDQSLIVPKGAAYIEEICTTYESRSYISLATALAASITYIRVYKVYDVGYITAGFIAVIPSIIIGLLFRKYLVRKSIGDIANIVPAQISFDDCILRVNGVYMQNIGLEDTRKRYLEDGVAVEVKTKSLGNFGIINDDGQRQAMINNIFIHMGIDKDVDEKDILAIAKTDLDKNSVVMVYIPLIKDMDEIIRVIKSTPIIESAKGKQSAYRKQY